MIEGVPLSRREFVLTTGSIACLMLGKSWTTDSRQSDLFTELIGRCGNLRQGYSLAAAVDQEQLKTLHAEQIAFCQSIASLQRPDGRRDRLFLRDSLNTDDTCLSTLSDGQGLTVEIVTTTLAMEGPSLSLRGCDGSVHGCNEKLWFSPRTADLCPWTDDSKLLPRVYARSRQLMEEQASENAGLVRHAQRMLRRPALSA